MYPGLEVRIDPIAWDNVQRLSDLVRWLIAERENEGSKDEVVFSRLTTHMPARLVHCKSNSTVSASYQGSVEVQVVTHMDAMCTLPISGQSVLLARGPDASRSCRFPGEEPAQVIIIASE
jgi:hypothetical protein